MQFSNVLGGTFTTLEPDPEPPVELEFSNVLGGTFTTSLTDLAITGATDYRHDAPCALTVQHVTGEYAVWWSPTTDHEHAGAVELAVVADDLTDGSGTIEVTADRGVVLYGTQGHLVLVDEADIATRQATLLLETNKRMVTLVAPLADPAEGITAIPGLAASDTLIWFNVIGGDVDDVEVFEDRSFSAAEGVTAFSVEAYDASAGEYTNTETQTVEEPVEPEHYEGGSSAVVEVASVGDGQIHASSGSLVAVEVEAKGQGSASVSGGAPSIVEVIARGGGSSEQAEHYSGGSSATVEVVSLGGGLLGVSSGSSSVVEILARGAGRPEASGGAAAVVEVIARGGGIAEVPDHYAGGSSAVIEVAARGSGSASVSGGSSAVVEIAARGGGTLTQLRRPVTHTSTRSLSVGRGPEIIHLGRDNPIVRELLQEGVSPEPGAITRVQARIAGKCYESPEVTLEGSVVTLRLGQSDLPRGTHRCELIVYDANHTNGIAWDRFFVIVRRQVACGE